MFGTAQVKLNIDDINPSPAVVVRPIFGKCEAAGVGQILELLLLLSATVFITHIAWERNPQRAEVQEKEKCVVALMKTAAAAPLSPVHLVEKIMELRL